MKVETISRESMPQVLNRTHGYYINSLRQLKATEAIRIERDNNEKISKISASFRSAAQRLNIKISVKSDDKYTYITLMD